MSENTPVPLRIRELREAQNLTQTQLGQLTGFTATTVSRHENGERGLNGEAIDRYANAFHVTPVEIFIDLDVWDELYGTRQRRTAEEQEAQRLERLRLAQEEEDALQKQIRASVPIGPEDRLVNAVKARLP